MKITNLLISGALSVAMAVSASANTISAAQKKDFEKIIHDYLIKNPEVLVEVSQSLQQKQQQNIQAEAQVAIAKNAAQIFSGKDTVVGNPKGSVTMVEFFDYQCIHCVKMAAIISELIAKDNNLRVIYKEFPIFGKSSEMASKAALAASMQGKYLEMHNALLAVGKRLDDKLILAAAKNLNLNMAKLESDMKSEEVAASLSANRKLGEKMHLMGTPIFIIASTPNGKYNSKVEAAFVPGASTVEVLQDLIKKVSST